MMGMGLGMGVVQGMSLRSPARNWLFLPLLCRSRGEWVMDESHQTGAAIRQGNGPNHNTDTTGCTDAVSLVLCHAKHCTLRRARPGMGWAGPWVD